MATKKKKKVRLTTNVIPQRYEIKLKPDLKTFAFEGEEIIHLLLKKPTKNIALHSVDLEIKSVQTLVRSTIVESSKISYNKKAETATFNFKAALPRGKIQLKLAFRGTLNDKMHGFYRSSFVQKGKTKYIATTQFESTDARRAFPCFDEPAMKAVFDVTLMVPTAMTAISNTVPTKTTKNSDGYKTVTFAPTPLMSTYLLAFIVGDFEYVQKKSKDGILVRVFVTPGKKHQAQFALDTATKIVTFFNEYFNIPYPLPVLDMIAIPDFAAGAMENWGAITYRESALLVDPKQSSTMNKQWVALVIAHEIAHQWFGNLVTMEWWTHLWLNEGFASYIEYLAVDHVFPSLGIWTQFLQADHGVALYYDALKNTHPIEVPVHHPAEIASVFDAVSYSKGASIIRMIAEYIGEKDFRDGLRLYLKTNAYKNAQTEDLWNSLAKVSRKPVGKIMANWTGKPGYPLVTIEDAGRNWKLRQSRFFASAISEKNTKDSTLWQIPIASVNAKGKRQKFLLNQKTTHISKTNEWFKINHNEAAVYRTSYPEELRARFAFPIAEKQLDTRDRLGLVRDVFALAEPGKLSATDGLAFAKHFAGETEYVVWSAIAGGLGKIHSLIAQESFEKAFNAYALNIFSDISKKITWNFKPKKHSDALLKVLVLESLGKYGHAKTIEKAQREFAKINKKKNGSSSLTINHIQPDLRGMVYGAVAKYGGPNDYAKLVKLYKAANLHEEKNRIGRALGNFRQKVLLQKTLNFAISKEVRPQDCVRMIASVTVNPEGRDLSWKFVQKNWETFLKRYTGSRELSYLLDPFGLSTSVKQAKEISSFLKKNPAPGTERTVQQVLEHIHSNAAWLARDRSNIKQFLV